jgi:hypothetical protein
MSATPETHFHNENCVPCEECQGTGFTIVGDHGCYGDVKTCKQLCPVPVDAECTFCNTKGCVPMSEFQNDKGDPFP